MSKINDGEKSHDNSGYNLMLFAVAGVFVIWISGFLISRQFFPKLAESGPAGDTFGGVTALFSGLAFAGIIVTLYLQRGDLQLQREMLEAQQEELQANREELRGQKEQMKLQNNFIEKQNFEATFFRLVQNFENLISGIEDLNCSGRAAISKKSPKVPPLGYPDGGFTNGRPTFRPTKTLDESLHTFDKFYYQRHEEIFGVYFRVLYNIFAYVDNANLQDDEKILRSDSTSGALI